METLDLDFMPLCKARVCDHGGGVNHPWQPELERLGDGGEIQQSPLLKDPGALAGCLA